MRRERVWMVQTEQQYICIHQCILAVLQVIKASLLFICIIPGWCNGIFFFIIFKGFEYVDSNNGTLGPNGGASAAAASSVHPSMSMTGGIHTREMHDNQGFEDEGIAESGMWDF